MQIGARLYLYISLLNAEVIVGQHIGIRPRLIRRVSHLGLAMLESRNHHAWFLRWFCFFPLLQLNNDNLLFLLRVQTRHDKVHALGSERNLIFYSHACIIGQFWRIHDLIHKLHRVLPRAHLIGRSMAPQVFVERLVNVVGNGVVEHIFNKLLFGGSIDDHCSLYFFELLYELYDCLSQFL